MKRVLILMFFLSFLVSLAPAQEAGCSGWFIQSKTFVPYLRSEGRQSVEEISWFARSVPDCEFGFFGASRIKLWKEKGAESRTAWFEAILGFSILPFSLHNGDKVQFNLNLGVGTENELWRVYAGTEFGNKNFNLSGAISGGGSEMWCKGEVLYFPYQWIGIGGTGEYGMGFGPKLWVNIPKTPVSFTGAFLWNSHKEKDMYGNIISNKLKERTYMFSVRLTFF